MSMTTTLEIPTPAIPIPDTPTPKTPTPASSDVQSALSSASVEVSLALSSITVSVDGSTSIQVVTITYTPIPTATSSDSTSTDQAATTIIWPASPSAFVTQTPSSRQLSTASIVGIALGSVAALILLVILLLFALGFRIQRAKWRRHSRLTQSLEPSDKRPAAVATSGILHGKAELPDTEYTRRLEGLHDGAKPELDGSTSRKLAWRFFSIRSASRRGTQHIPAELGTEPPLSGPHELPGNGVSQTISEEPHHARDAT